MPTATLSTSLPSLPVPVLALPPLFVDISSALSFSDSQRLLAAWLKQHPSQSLETTQVALDCGSLVLTGKMLSKLLETLRQQGLSVTMVYARLSQTQQAALSCGLGVKEYPPANEEALSSDGYAASPLATALVAPPEPLFSLVEPSVVERLPSVTERTAAEETPILSSIETLEGLSSLQTTAMLLENITDVVDSTSSVDPMPLVSLDSDVPKSLSERMTVESLGETAASKPDPSLVTVPAFLEAPTVTHYQATAADTLVPVPATGAEAMPTRLVTGTLRSGQTVVSEGHLLVMGDVHSGSEIIARGHIVVWGELRGVAHAGAPLKAGDAPQQWASIRALLLRAVQLRIGSTIARRPDRTSNHKPESPVDRAWHPEFARMVDGEIRIQADLNPGHSIDFV
ncbi:MAG: septum site-determining protein MinC [Vampirovibrionales bacterium]|nr:septum site-determining protein MinC [Vampirovibrionales bacterium]